MLLLLLLLCLPKSPIWKFLNSSLLSVFGFSFDHCLFATIQVHLELNQRSPVLNPEVVSDSVHVWE